MPSRNVLEGKERKKRSPCKLLLLTKLFFFALAKNNLILRSTQYDRPLIFQDFGIFLQISICLNIFLKEEM